MENMTQSQLTRYLLAWGPDFLRWVGDEKISVSRRLNNLIQLLDQKPDRLIEDGSYLREQIVDVAFGLFGQSPGALSEDQEKMRRALERERFTIRDGAIRRALPFDLSGGGSEDEVTSLLIKHGFRTSKGHLEQAYTAHTNGHWASANAQVRSFLEGLMDEIAERIDPSVAALPSGHARRTKLAAAGFLSRELNEWDDKGTGFINGLMKRLHPHGSHPGLSDQDDSTFRLNTALLSARLLLTRFDAITV